MHPLRLARVAAEAEILRLRRIGTRTATRVVFGLAALGFLGGAVAFFHFAAWFWLRRSFEPAPAALILAGADLVIALALALLAARSSPSRVELEALAVRRRALEGMASTVAFTTLASQLLRFALPLFRRSRR